MSSRFDDDEAARPAEKRLFVAFRRLGTDRPICVRCRYTYAHALEVHHLVGSGLDGTTAIFCRNCHRELTDVQQGWPEACVGTLADNLISARLMFGLADIFATVAPALEAYAQTAAVPEAVRDFMISVAKLMRDNVEPLRHNGRLLLGYDGGGADGQVTG